MPETIPNAEKSVEKEVKASMSGAKVYLARDWAGEDVEITRVTDGESVTKEAKMNMGGAHVHVSRDWLGEDVVVTPADEN